MTKLYGLLGGNVEHSLSPQIHKLIYERFDISADYQLYCGMASLQAVCQKIKEDGVAGFNVTIPYKQSIMPLLDRVTERAQKMNSVNTVSLRDGRYIGDNTDAYGFGESLKHNQLSLKNKTVLVIGAGGAASAVIHHLIENRAKMILIYNRTRFKTNQLMLRIKQIYDWHNVISVFDFHGLVVDAVVNATPLGGVGYELQAPLDLSVTTAELYVDLIYRPKLTQTIKAGRDNGIKVLGGLDMLVYQALESTSIWHRISYSMTDAKEIIDHVSTLY